MKFSILTILTYVIASATETAAATYVEYHGMDTNWKKQERNRWFFGFNGKECLEWTTALGGTVTQFGNVQCGQTGADKWYYHITVAKGDSTDSMVLWAVKSLFKHSWETDTEAAKRICPVFPSGWIRDVCNASGL